MWGSTYIVGRKQGPFAVVAKNLLNRLGNETKLKIVVWPESVRKSRQEHWDEGQGHLQVNLQLGLEVRGHWWSLRSRNTSFKLTAKFKWSVEAAELHLSLWPEFGVGCVPVVPGSANHLSAVLGWKVSDIWLAACSGKASHCVQSPCLPLWWQSFVHERWVIRPHTVQHSWWTVMMSPTNKNMVMLVLSSGKSWHEGCRISWEEHSCSGMTMCCVSTTPFCAIMDTQDNDLGSMSLAKMEQETWPLGQNSGSEVLTCLMEAPGRLFSATWPM